jgi:hypothetical protein
MALTYCLADPADPDSPYVSSPDYRPVAYQLKHHEYPPTLTVLSERGSVPSLMLLAMVAGGGRGLLFEKMVGLAMDESLIKVTFHSLANRIQF